MNRRTKLALPALTAATALALSACGGGSGSGGSESSGAGGGEFTPPDNVRMIVPFGAGGGSDLAGRATASGLEEVIEPTITVENLTGGDGAIGYSELLASNGDPGALLASETALMALPITQDVEFTYQDFTPIMKLGDDYSVVMVNADSPHETCMDLINAAEDGGVATGIAGAASMDTVAFGLMEQEFDIEFETIVFESGAEILAAVLGGHIDAGMTNPGEVMGQLESGDVKALCALAPERYTYEGLSEIPTGVEQGVDITFAQWRGFIAAGGISEEARRYWIEAGQEFAETEAYTEYIESNLLQPQPLYGDEFVSYLDEYNENLKAVFGDM